MSAMAITTFQAGRLVANLLTPVTLASHSSPIAEGCYCLIAILLSGRRLSIAVIHNILIAVVLCGGCLSVIISCNALVSVLLSCGAITIGARANSLIAVGLAIGLAVGARSDRSQ